MNAYETIRKSGIVAILRGIKPEYLESTVKALYDGGVRCVEITLNTPGALRMIEKAKDICGEKMAIGAGTVLEAASARSAMLAGASFVLAPTLDTAVIEICNIYGCLPIPGVFTPTEALTAWKAGAPIVKVFPCGSVGPTYIKDLKGPLSQIPMMPVGGVSLANARDFFAAGACALGVGSSLFDPKLAEAGDFAEIQHRAESFLRIAAENLPV